MLNNIGNLGITNHLELKKSQEHGIGSLIRRPKRKQRTYCILDCSFMHNAFHCMNT